MSFVRRYRIPALCCALAVLLCELIARPYTTMGICDDGPYILMARTLATTGHFAYNGWATAMMGWQLYLGAAFIKLFGPSFTSVRMSTMLVAMALAFLFQRTLVRVDVSERNATIGTLALVLSPLYLMLSVSFMSDISGLFAIVICLYGCLRALQAATSGATIGWLCFAVISNTICGTSRQIAWLGVLVMVPSALWLLRGRRQIVLAGAVADFTGVLFIIGCLQWLKHQPYTIPEHLLPDTFLVGQALSRMVRMFLDMPFLLLPIVILFLPSLRKSDRRFIAVSTAGLFAYALLSIHKGHFRLLEPTLGDWINVHGTYAAWILGEAPIVLDRTVQILLTIGSIGGLIGLTSSLIYSIQRPSVEAEESTASWKKLGVLLAPFTFVYILLLLPRAASIGLADRYTLGLLGIALLCMVRYYQERIQSQLPLLSVLFVGITAAYGISVTHDTFALYRARVAIAAELVAAGVPITSVDNGWEYNFVLELHHSDHLNDPRIAIPADAYVSVPATSLCEPFWYDRTPHIHPLYGVSFDPNSCYGPAPFAAMHYSRWLATAPGTIYVVRYTPPSKP